MQTLKIELRKIDDNVAQLRYSLPSRPKHEYESQTLQLAEINQWLKAAKLDYYLGRPELVKMGRGLFNWLDGDGRLLSRAMKHCRTHGLVMAIDANEGLAHLPWEVLHDGKTFLVQRVNPVVPVRWIPEDASAWEPEERKSLDGPLRVLFMATSPEGVEPVLDFEAEEAEILADTADSPLEVRVEESGCVARLGKVWSRYIDEFDVFHLTGHASIETREPYTPYFVTETELGKAYHATAEELGEAFRFRWPAVVFLSGCRTGQGAKNGAVPSMAEALIKEGAGAVLGWGRPVTDRGATQAAAHLYGRLAEAYSLPQALAKTYSKLLKDNVTDWHLLRLYVRGDCPGALANPQGDEVWMRPESSAEEFLDPATQQVRVATAAEFVGRRRELQRCLQALGNPRYTGVVLHGMGGNGKSTLAARLLERLTGYDPVVFYRGLDEAQLWQKLGEQCETERGHEILNGKLPPMQRLAKFLREGLNGAKQRFAFVLDDFEANLEDVGDGTYRLKPKVVPVLGMLLDGIARSKLPHRVLITSRYDFAMASGNRTGNHRLYREMVPGLRGADWRKKCDRLPAFNAQSEVDEDLQQRAKEAADGNPRLLEWLGRVLEDGNIEPEGILTAMEGVAAKFREEILAQKLLESQPQSVRQMLGLGLVYRLPVPKEALEAIWGEINRWEDFLPPVIALGLLETSQKGTEEGTQTQYRVPRILAPLLEEVAQPQVRPFGVAAKALYRLWWQEAETSTEEQRREIHRLAMLGEEAEIAATIATALSRHWKNRSRFREAVALCRETLSLTEDYRTLHQLARSEAEIGDVEAALTHYEAANECCPPENEQEKSAIIHNLAGLHVDRGQIERAVQLYQESLSLEEQIGDVQGKAATLHCLAILHANQGQIERAVQLYQQSLSLKEQIGDVQGKAATLHCLAILHANQGQIERAVQLYQQSLSLKEQIGDVQGKAATLHQLAGLHADRGQIERAVELYQESLSLKEQIGDVQGKAATLHCLAVLHANRGQIERAVELYQESLSLKEQIGNVQGKAATLHCLAVLHANRGQIERAVELYQESLSLKEQIGNVQGKAATLAMLGQLLADARGEREVALEYLQESLSILEHLKSPDAATVREIIARI